MSAPKVSVLMPVYNGSDYLQESIDSILSQTYTDFEFVIIDDASTDDTWAILQHNAGRDPRIRLLQNPQNLGLIMTLNKGIEAATGQYIARQDADDISLPQRLAREVQVMDGQPDCVMVSSNIQVIQNDNPAIIEVLNRACSPERVTWYLLFYNHVGGHSQVMYRRDAVMALGGYSQAQPHIEDYELWCRLSRTDAKIVILPETLLTYRRHGQSVSAQKGQEQEQNRRKQVKDNIRDLIGKDLSLEQAKVLIGFWRGNRQSIFEVWHHRFPASSEAAFIHTTLAELKQGFVKQYQAMYPDANLDQELNRLIGQQFLCWLRSPLTKHHSLASKVEIASYARRWSPSPLAVWGNWAGWLLRSPVDLSISAYRKFFAGATAASLSQRQTDAV